MSKLQLLYEKLMKMMYIFAGIFFVLFLIDLFIAISTNAFDCSEVLLCEVREDSLFIKFSLYPIAAATVLFIIGGRVFFGLAHKESDLMSVSDYRRSVETTDSSGQVISREEISERFRNKNKKSDNVISKTGKQVQKVFTGVKSKSELREIRKQEQKEAKEKLKLARKTEKELLQKIEAEKRQEEDSKKARKKLNKTELILYVAEVAKLSQNDARKFINSFTEIIRETVESDEEVKIAKFGKFSKEHIEETTEINPITNAEKIVEAHNTVEFFAYKAFLDQLNGEDTIEEFIEEDEEIVIAETIDDATVVEEVVAETVDEETPKEEIVTEELVEESPIEKAVKVEVVEETPAEVEVVEEVIEETPAEVEVIEEVVEKNPEKAPVVEDDFDDLKSIPDATDEEEEIEEEIIQEEDLEEYVAEVKTAKVEEEKTETVKVLPVVSKSALDDLASIPNEDEKAPKEKVLVKSVAKAKPKKAKITSRTKTDIIIMIDNETDLSKNKANKFLKYFAEVVKEELSKGENVDLEGIGYFTTIEMPAKEAVNPQTQEKIIVPSHHQVRLRFDDDLKAKMNE